MGATAASTTTGKDTGIVAQHETTSETPLPAGGFPYQHEIFGRDMKPSFSLSFKHYGIRYYVCTTSHILPHAVLTCSFGVLLAARGRLS